MSISKNAAKQNTARNAIGANAISEQVSKELLQECGIVWRMLIKSITTTKEKK